MYPLVYVPMADRDASIDMSDVGCGVLLVYVPVFSILQSHHCRRRYRCYDSSRIDDEFDRNQCNSISAPYCVGDGWRIFAAPWNRDQWCWYLRPKYEYFYSMTILEHLGLVVAAVAEVKCIYPDRVDCTTIYHAMK